jgi:long-chain fatty acid transport protein
VGFGVDFVFTRLKWWHGQLFPLSNSITHARVVESQYKMDGNGMGFAAGMLWKAHKRIQLGIRYQHKVKIELKGDNRLWATDSFEIVEIPDLNDFPMDVTEKLIEFRVPQPIDSQLTWPAEFAAGLMVVPWDSLLLHFDLNWQGWSEFGEWSFANRKPEEYLNREFYDRYFDTYGIALPYGSQRLPLEWKDVWNLKFGLEFKLSRVLGLRAGYAFHPSAIQGQDVEPVTADLDRQILSFGIGYEGPLFSIWDFEEQGGFSFDAFLQYQLSKEMRSTLPGFEFVYNTDRLVFGVGVGLTF